MPLNRACTRADGCAGEGLTPVWDRAVPLNRARTRTRIRRTPSTRSARRAIPAAGRHGLAAAGEAPPQAKPRRRRSPAAGEAPPQAKPRRRRSPAAG
ncbi:hypothetical protein AB0I22_36360, partial [Streptomyces sp. NPDC050610]